MIITLGSEGALYCRVHEAGHVPAPSVEVIDTTGAGDAFVGAAAARLTIHDDLADGCLAGVRSGARTVQHSPNHDAADGRRVDTIRKRS